MICRDKLRAMSELEITEIHTETLIDIDSAPVDAVLPAEDKLHTFIQHIRNPYCYMCDGTPVRIRFVVGEKTLSQSLGDYFINLKR